MDSPRCERIYRTRKKTEEELRARVDVIGARGGGDDLHKSREEESDTASAMVQRNSEEATKKPKATVK